jgi:ABC-type transporter Mla subunit MlaD
MKRRISPVKLGLFILICGAIGAVAVIWLGATSIFESSKKYAAYFDEPVTGLEAGAPVRYLGVRVGSIDSVELAPGDRLVQVLVKIRSGFHLDPSMALAVTQPGITGSPFLSLEDTPAEQRKETHPSETKYPLLPTRAGGGGIGAAVRRIEKKISSIDIEGIVTRWEDVAARIDSTLSRGDLDRVIENARVTSSGLRRIAAAGPDGEPSQIESTVRDLRSATRSLRAATTSIAKQVDDIKPGVDASVVLLREDLAQLKQAAIEAQSLARSLRTQPGQLLEHGGQKDPFSR